ncbi:MAG: 3-dehydroquinate synthase [Rikenellaceae bacterium]
MKSFTVEVKNGRKVYIGNSAELLGELLPKGGRVVVITDSTIQSHYGTIMEGYERIVIGEGEGNKTLQSVETICRKLLEMGADRKVFLLGIGGGIVSDVTGFVASIYMRGVDFGFISTTLLSQVDAGVGGKNGVNLDGYKNIIGCFNQPHFVICDTSMLKTLSDREFRSGLAELIKGAIIADSELFTQLEGMTFQELRQCEQTLAAMVLRAVEIKAEIVARDEREAGDRRLLNLGHTYAHAIEKLSREMTHGEAVAVGCVIACGKSVNRGMMSAQSKERIEAMLERMEFVTTPPVEQSKLDSVIGRDKKAEGDSIYFVFPVEIGRCVAEKIELSQLISH